jgi:hypothetical protein
MAPINRATERITPNNLFVTLRLFIAPLLFWKKVHHIGLLP